MFKHFKPALVATIFVLVVATGAPAPTLGLEKPAQDEEERFRAFAIVMGNRVRGRAGVVDIVVNRWTTDEERAQLLEVVTGNDQSAIRQALADQEMTGWITVPGSGRTRHQLRYARDVRYPETGERMILLATDRIIPFVEAWNRPRTFDYDVTLIQLKLDENNEGGGVAALGVKFTLDEGELIVEHFGSQPVTLNSVRRTN